MAIDKLFFTQNEKLYINYLKAQRVLYSEAKGYLDKAGFGDLIFLVIGGSISTIIPSLADYVAIFSVAWLLFSHLIRQSAKSLIKKASIVQEMFDVGLFEIKWNDTLGQRIPKVEIIEASDKFDGKLSKLKNWYFKSDETNHWETVIGCQKTNLNWDCRLREKYKNMAIAVMVGFIVILIVSFYLLDLNFRFISTAIIAPCLPFILTTYGNYIENKRLIEEKDVLRKMLESKRKPSELRSRQIQDKIFELRNSMSVLPDWFYWFFRNSFERQEKISVKIPEK